MIKNISAGKNSSSQNPLQILNNLQNGTVYKLVSTAGTPHNPTFTMEVTANGQKFIGKGASKKLARYEAASEALKTYQDTTPVKTGKKPTKPHEIVPPPDLITELKRMDWDPSRREISKVKLKNGNTVNVIPKNPLALLNEIHKGVSYDVISKTGSPNKPNFTVQVKIFDRVYTGQGSSIRLARMQAAVAVLASLLILRNEITDFLLERPGEKQQMDLITAIRLSLNMGPFERTCPIIEPSAGISKSKQNPIDPISLLYKMFPNSHFECKLNEERHTLIFHMIVRVNGTPFEGRGQSKKAAKLSAAKTALAALCHLSFNTPSLEKNINDGSELSQVFADEIGRLVTEKYYQLMQGDSENIVKRKILAGFVMTRNFEHRNPEIICITTGNRCINGEYMSRFGVALNDSHAEILARRCLIDYFYTQLEMIGNPFEVKHSIFQKPTSPGKLYTIKEGIEFHLYISISPCGDARVFGPHEKLFIATDTPRDNKRKGLLRSKVEAGEGTIPISSSSGIQTWDGILAGEKLLTMSCSDKICRWNVVGLQGALLSNVIEPIYLHSLVLGSVFDPVHVYRGICGRLDDSVQNLPTPFRLNKPKLALISSVEERNMAKTTNLSINWTVGNDTIETVDATLGITIRQHPSRICKHAFFEKYLAITKILPLFENVKVPRTYGEAKIMAGNFQAAKRELFNAFTKLELGTWIKKPIEQDEFEAGT